MWLSDDEFEFADNGSDDDDSLGPVDDLVDANCDEDDFEASSNSGVPGNRNPVACRDPKDGILLKAYYRSIADVREAIDHARVDGA